MTGKNWNEKIRLETGPHTVTAYHSTGEIVQLAFSENIKLTCDGKNYEARTAPHNKRTYVAISFHTSSEEYQTEKNQGLALVQNPEPALRANAKRWNHYLKKILRADMPGQYNRIAAKSVVTLLSNWRAKRQSLLHDGVFPSHAVPNFLGFWAWDTWRIAVALSRFAPELAKNSIRSMFDYQEKDGMVIDCIFTNPARNNTRNTKAPLAGWAVDQVFMQTHDTAFVREMYPKLLAYHKWWYAKRDHNQNGICEFGSVDGSLEAAKWESGMDNAIRFDSVKILKNQADNAWSLDQESVDLNTYLAYEHKLLEKFATILNIPFNEPEHATQIADYFFNEKIGWFCDRQIDSKKFIEEPSCEGYTPFWTQIASKKQMNKAIKLLRDTEKFSTFIPFPTTAADNPKCSTDGYWRGPIWLDQTYLAIKGIRNYGRSKLANMYTRQVFDRCEGLAEDGAIYENYDTHKGTGLRAPHFSWSAAHLLLLYEDYGH